MVRRRKRLNRIVRISVRYLVQCAYMRMYVSASPIEKKRLHTDYKYELIFKPRVNGVPQTCRDA